MSKSNPVHNLFKVPDSAIVKNQAVEIGMLKSEIEELKHKLKIKKLNILSEKIEKSNNKQVAKLKIRISKFGNLLQKKEKRVKYWKSIVSKLVSFEEVEKYESVINFKIKQ